MESCVASDSPLSSNPTLLFGNDPDSSLPYRTFTGVANWVQRVSRPDISHSVTYHSQFNSCFQKAHFESVKKLFRYLSGTAHYCLTYHRAAAKRGETATVTIMTDSDWAQNYDRKSFMGIIVYFCNCPVAWCSTKQSIQALSTMEAEFVANVEGVKWGLYICNLMDGVCDIETPISLYGDNSAAKEFSSKLGCNLRTKHISVRYHFIKEYTAVLKMFVLKHVPSAKNLADILTKGLSGERTRYIATHLLGLSHDASSPI